MNRRLTCCACGADLGDAEDPYRDPSCIECLNRQEMEYPDDDDERYSAPETANDYGEGSYYYDPSDEWNQ